MRSTRTVAAIAVAVGLAVPASAGAAQVTYPEGATSTFADSAGGWTNGVEQTGLCVPGLTCPIITNSWEATGGAQGTGDGFIRTSSAGLTSVGVAATSQGIWTSPPFTYDGLNGAVPNDLSFRISRRANVDELLSVVGAQATFSVELLNESGGSGVTLIAGQSLSGATEFVNTSAAALEPSQLRVGSTYRFRITTTLNTPVGVLPAATADYDNVVLRAADAPGGGGGGGGNDGGGGNNGGGGGDGADGKAPPASFGLGVAYLYKGKLFVMAKCPKKFKPKCKARSMIASKRKGGKVLSKAKRAGIKSGKKKRIAIKVKPRFKNRVTKGKRVFLRMNVKSKKGKKKGKVIRKVRVIER